MTVKRLFRLFKNGIKYIFDRKYRFTVDTYRGKYVKLSDEDYVKLATKVYFGKEIDLDNPVTFNEELQWLKLYDRKPQYTTMVDKYLAKKYVTDIIGEQYIIPTLGVWDRFEDIDFDSLPNEFVLKCTHDSGGLVICRDKSNFDFKKAKRKINRSLKRDLYLYSREWPYKNVQKRIIAEKFMSDNESSDGLTDYKFFCFDGVAKLMFVATDRNNASAETKFDFFDMEFNHLPFTNGHPNSAEPIKKPSTFDEMRNIAEKLSKGIPHVRVDLYEINGKVYFGEMTFYHWGGLKAFDPEEWDEKLGRLIVLPEKTVED